VILVDTSVLTGFFKGIEKSFYDKMNYLVDNDIPFGMEMSRLKMLPLCI
jgi:hypothetical protein